MVGGISPDTGRHFHPPRLRHYLTKTSEVHYAMRPAQEGDIQQR